MGLTIGVAMKWTGRLLGVDALSGEPSVDAVSAGASAADEAALELALRLAERWQADVMVAACGPPPADAMLRDALAAGAGRAVRVEVEPGPLPGSAASVEQSAAGLARATAGCGLVICGDYSRDGGSGAVPALLAARLGAAQALGLVSVEPADEPDVLLAERRLDGGRRERLRIRLPTVISVEPGLARLRRAPLPAALAAASADVRVLGGAAHDRRPDVPVALSPYRPRARRIPAPDASLPPAERIRALLGVAGAREAARVVRGTPQEAAAEILEQLRRWEYV